MLRVRAWLQRIIVCSQADQQYEHYSQRKRRLSPNSETVAEIGDYSLSVDRL